MKFTLVKQLNEIADAIIAEKLASSEASAAKNVGKATAKKVYRRDYLKTKDRSYRTEQ